MDPIELLIVDDNAAEALLLLYALEECSRPVKFRFAKDGAEGLRFMSERTFDLIILDLNLPGMSGYDVLEQCDPQHVPVVIFSVSSNPEDAQRAMELGAREFVHKPVGIEPYKAAVLGMIEKWVPEKARKEARA